METETRVTADAQLEVRALGDTMPTIVAGYAVVFDSWSSVMYDARGKPFREKFSATAFDRALAAQPDVRALWNHDPNLPLGRVRNNTLRIEKDSHGLRFELIPPDTNWGRDAVTSIGRGDVSGMSFAFAPTRDGTITQRGGLDGIAERTVTDADIFEVSPVTFPAYPETHVTVRSLTLPDFEVDSQEAETIPATPDGRASVRELALNLLDIELLEATHEPA